MKSYYVCIRKSDNKIVICTGKSSVKAFSGISSDTIRRHENELVYINKEYILYINVELINKYNNKCCNNYMQMWQTKPKRVVKDNISKYNNLPHLLLADTAKQTITVDGCEYDKTQPIPGLF